MKHFYRRLILLTLNMFLPATGPLMPYTSDDNFWHIIYMSSFVNDLSLMWTQSDDDDNDDDDDDDDEFFLWYGWPTKGV